MTDQLYGYEAVEENSSSRYLSLDKKGDSIKIRLATPPKHSFRFWEIGPDGKNRIGGAFPTREDCMKALEEKYPDPTTRPKISVQYGWIVIDRADGQPKIFKGGQQIASTILGIVRSGWGDPTGFDLSIVRTEGNPYYEVLPVPKTDQPLSEVEKTLVAESGLDVDAEMGGASSSKSHDAETYGGAVELDTLPEEKEEGGIDVEADDDETEPLPF